MCIRDSTYTVRVPPRSAAVCGTGRRDVAHGRGTCVCVTGLRHYGAADANRARVRGRANVCARAP
eukprot:2649849-Prymnesium_polylepis.1